jgi:hypothetical protein
LGISTRENLCEEHPALVTARLLLAGNPAFSPAQQTTGEIEPSRRWKINGYNPDIVAPLLADKFVSTEADGKVSNKAQMLADACTANIGSSS